MVQWEGEGCSRLSNDVSLLLMTVEAAVVMALFSEVLKIGPRNLGGGEREREKRS